MRRVVITGIGPVTPVGSGIETFWESLKAGKNGIGPITRFDTANHAMKIAGEVRDIDLAQFMSPKLIRRTDRFTQYAVAAAKLAWLDAGEPMVDRARTGVMFSTGIGGFEAIINAHNQMLSKGPDRVTPFMIPAMMPNAAAGQVAMALGFTGPNACITTACAAGAHAVGEGYRLIKEGLADACMTGGAEEASELGTVGFWQMGALSRNSDAEQASRPFDKDRDGFVMAEGACALVLEEAEAAMARGARIYAEVAGYGASADAYHITAPDPEGLGAVQAIQMALATAGEPPEAVGYINAHGTSTQLNDAAESRAIKKALGDHAYRTPVSSTKSMTGHMLGAAGAVEAAASALVVRDGVIPPTIHYRTPDSECDLDYVPNEARRSDVRLALSNAFGFGGQNAALAIRRFEA